MVPEFQAKVAKEVTQPLSEPRSLADVLERAASELDIADQRHTLESSCAQCKGLTGVLESADSELGILGQRRNLERLVAAAGVGFAATGIGDLVDTNMQKDGHEADVLESAASTLKHASVAPCVAPEFSTNSEMFMHASVAPEFGTNSEMFIHASVAPEFSTKSEMFMHTNVAPEFNINGKMFMHASVAPEVSTNSEMFMHASMSPKFGINGEIDDHPSSIPKGPTHGTDETLSPSRRLDDVKGADDGIRQLKGFDNMSTYSYSISSSMFGLPCVWIHGTDPRRRRAHVHVGASPRMEQQRPASRARTRKVG
jgi:hypothetical protein